MGFIATWHRITVGWSSFWSPMAGMNQSKINGSLTIAAGAAQPRTAMQVLSFYLGRWDRHSGVLPIPFFSGAHMLPKVDDHSLIQLLSPHFSNFFAGGVDDYILN